METQGKEWIDIVTSQQFHVTYLDGDMPEDVNYNSSINSLASAKRRSPSITITFEEDEESEDYWNKATEQLRYIDSVEVIDAQDFEYPTRDCKNLQKQSLRKEDDTRQDMEMLSPQSRTASSISGGQLRPNSGISRISGTSFKRLTERLKNCSWGEGETNQRRRQSALHQNVANAKLEVEQTFLLMGSYHETRDARYYFQHPLARIFVCFLVILCNFLMFAEDPVSHSRAESEIQIIGNVFSFVLTRYPPQWTWAAVKVLMWILAVICGMIFGKSIIHAFLGRILRLKMFRDDQGSWMTMFLTVLISLYLFSHVYNMLIYFCRVDPAYRINSRMYVTNSSVMKAAACGTWLGDLITALMVIDMMLQDTLYPQWAPWLRNKWRSSNAPRILLFWVGSALATVVVLTLIISDWISWDRLNHDFISTTEVSRAYLASFILVMDLVIVMQDWDFPHFTTTHHVNLPGLRVATLRWNFAQVKITGKWFNYGIIFCVMIFDLNMWKNQIFYDPAFYGQYIGKDDKIHTVVDKQLLLTGNSSLWSYQTRISNDPRTGKPYYLQDRIMNSQFIGTPMAGKLTAVIPSVFGLSLFITLIALYGRFPISQNGSPTAKRANIISDVGR